jgi:hypothetical protein
MSERHLKNLIKLYRMNIRVFERMIREAQEELSRARR